MKITVAKPDLEAALSVARLTTGSSTDLSAHYLFRVKEGRAEVLSFDLRTFSCASFVANADEDGQFTVEAWRLDKWVASVSNGVLEFSTAKKGEVVAKGGRSRVRFRSLDANRFPFWDELIPNSTSHGKVRANNLVRAFSACRPYISDDDTVKPEMCQIEGISGTLYATDRTGLIMVDLRALPDINLRIPGKDLPSVVKFLSSKDVRNDEVEVKTFERSSDGRGGRSILFIRGDGAYVGVAEPFIPLNKIKMDRDAPATAVLNLNWEEFSAGMAVLLAGAPKSWSAVTFIYDHEKEQVSLRLPCEAGGFSEYPLQSASVEDDQNLKDPICIRTRYLQGIQSLAGSNDLRLRIYVFPQGGYFSFQCEDEPPDGIPVEESTSNVYFVVIIWQDEDEI